MLSRLKGIETYEVFLRATLAISLTVPSRLKGIETQVSVPIEHFGLFLCLTVPSRLKGIETVERSSLPSTNPYRLTVPSRLKGIETAKTTLSRKNPHHV